MIRRRQGSLFLLRGLGMPLLVAIAGVVARADEIFVDVTASAGIDFRHVSGAKGLKILPESMIGGAGWFDYDGDGHLDLYLVQGHGDSTAAAKKGDVGNVLYRNRGDGTFEDVTERAGVGDRSYGAGLAVGDIDNDGDIDLYVTNVGANTLYRNEGDGTFVDITAEAGVACPYWSASAAFADVNGDGLLDLFVANYLVYDCSVQRGCTGNVKKIPAYCHPNKYDGAPDSLFINLGKGRFKDVSKAAGVTLTGRIRAKGLGVLPTDYDLDGDIDFFVANDSVPNFLWRNLGNGKFEDAALEAGLALNSNGSAEACMGIDGGDINGDGLQDYFVTNFSEETDTMFLGEGDGFFYDGTHRSGLVEPTYQPLGFGTKLFDYDLDGDLDIYVTRGHIIDNIQEVTPGTELRYRQPDQLLENNGKGQFTDVSGRSGKWFQERLVGRGAAFADYDSDGDLDVLLVNSADRAVLLRNRVIEERKPQWIGFRLRGPDSSNRDAYGARVTVRANSSSSTFEVRSAASYLAANDPRVLVGLGTKGVAGVSIVVRWPDGMTEEFRDLVGGRYHEIVRATGRAIKK